MQSFQLLGTQGPFHKEIDFFRARSQQQQLAGEIERFVIDGGVLAVESPTGTGKTMAYLAPIINSGKTAIISTATKHLQDQLFYKDLPLVLKTLGVKNNSCLLKGRQNYLCLHRLHTHAGKQIIENDSLVGLYRDICEFSITDESGDINNIPDLPEDSVFRRLITSTTDNCLGSKCVHFDDCFVRKARNKAMQADIVIINHHLYLSHYRLKSDGFGNLLPKTDVIVFDEAHGLADIATMSLTQRFSSNQLFQLTKDISDLEKNINPTSLELIHHCQSIDDELTIILKSIKQQVKIDAQLFFKDKILLEKLHTLLESIDHLAQAIKLHVEKSREYEMLYQRVNRLGELLGECLFNEFETDKYFCWANLSNKNINLNLTPLTLGEFGASFTQLSYKSTFFISATLANSMKFDFFTTQMGLQNITTKAYSSPFDLEKQCKLYLPSLPIPSHPEFLYALLTEAVSIIKSSRGRCFFLFTSHLAMDWTYENSRKHLPFPLLKQGQMPKHELIAKFKSFGNAVLFATHSFWEGVDIKGEALSCLIIDKLPFTSPDDPVLKARLQRIEQNNNNPFMDYQLPQMIITLKQGIGRLIRDENDKGMIMIADSRISNKSYGKRIVAALAKMPITTKQDEAIKYLKSI